MMVKYREATEEEEKAFYETPEGKVALKEEEERRAFLETPEGKAFLEKQEEERAYQYQEPDLEEILALEAEREAYQEKKYEKKKYIDEDGVWIPRIVKLVIFILFWWLALNTPIIIDNMMRYR